MENTELTELEQNIEKIKNLISYSSNIDRESVEKLRDVLEVIDGIIRIKLAENIISNSSVKSRIQGIIDKKIDEFKKKKEEIARSIPEITNYSDVRIDALDKAIRTLEDIKKNVQKDFYDGVLKSICGGDKESRKDILYYCLDRLTEGYNYYPKYLKDGLLVDGNGKLARRYSDNEIVINRDIINKMFSILSDKEFCQKLRAYFSAIARAGYAQSNLETRETLLIKLDSLKRMRNFDFNGRVAEFKDIVYEDGIYEHIAEENKYKNKIKHLKDEKAKYSRGFISKLFHGKELMDLEEEIADKEALAGISNATVKSAVNKRLVSELSKQFPGAEETLGKILFTSVSETETIIDQEIKNVESKLEELKDQESYYDTEMKAAAEIYQSLGDRVDKIPESELPLFESVVMRSNSNKFRLIVYMLKVLSDVEGLSFDEAVKGYRGGVKKIETLSQFYEERIGEYEKKKEGEIKSQIVAAEGEYKDSETPIIR